MLKGTRIIEGFEVRVFNDAISTLRNFLSYKGFEEIIVPSIWEPSTFKNKVGEENSKMMWEFKDKGDRDVCLIPEVTGIIQEKWREDWSKKMSKRNVFYVQRCYRYEKPQEGRYREFTQVGIEMLGKDVNVEESKTILDDVLRILQIHAGKFDYIFTDNVKRGLSYYIEDGFEASCDILGAQKQIAGGGRYNEGVGWAIGIDRLVLAIMKGRKI